MKKHLKISILAVFATIFVTTMSIAAVSEPKSAPKTLVDYLNDKNVSFLIVNSGPTARLTTFGWQDAAKGCATIRTAGFNVSKIRNYSTQDRVETVAECRN